MIEMPVSSWELYKTLISDKSLKIQYYETSTTYELFAFEQGPIVWKIALLKDDGEDVTDWENNYKSNSNQPLGLPSQFDTDGSTITRLKAAKKGWSFLALAPEIITSTLGTLFCKDYSGNDVSGITYKIYNGNDEEITTPGLAGINLAACVKTILDIELPYDYELVGGALRINSNPSQDIRLWIVGAPDIPAQYGGSKEFASGINLKFMAPNDSFEIDGRVTKYITYSSQTHSGKIRIILKHPAGLQVNMQIVMHIYRQ